MRLKHFKNVQHYTNLSRHCRKSRRRKYWVRALYKYSTRGRNMREVANAIYAYAQAVKESVACRSTAEAESEGVNQ